MAKNTPSPADNEDHATHVELVFGLYNVKDYAPQLDTLRANVTALPNLSRQIKGMTPDARQASIDTIICQAISNVLKSGNDLYKEEEIDFISMAINDELTRMDRELGRKGPPTGRSR